MSAGRASVTIGRRCVPDHVFKGTVGSLSPGTGAHSRSCRRRTPPAIFVKVVQRVPVRIYFGQQR